MSGIMVVLLNYYLLVTPHPDNGMISGLKYLANRCYQDSPYGASTSGVRLAVISYLNGATKCQ